MQELYISDTERAVVVAHKYTAKQEAYPEWRKFVAEVRPDREPFATIVELRISEEIEV
jgi:hypothetical protein